MYEAIKDDGDKDNAGSNMMASAFTFVNGVTADRSKIGTNMKKGLLGV